MYRDGGDESTNDLGTTTSFILVGGIPSTCALEEVEKAEKEEEEDEEDEEDESTCDVVHSVGGIAASMCTLPQQLSFIDFSLIAPRAT